MSVVLGSLLSGSNWVSTIRFQLGLHYQVLIRSHLSGSNWGFNYVMIVPRKVNVIFDLVKELNRIYFGV